MAVNAESSHVMDFNPFDAHNEINGQHGNGGVVIKTSASSKRVNVSAKSAVSTLESVLADTGIVMVGNGISLHSQSLAFSFC